MPHKVNPIDFENAEGNFGVANADTSDTSSIEAAGIAPATRPDRLDRAAQRGRPHRAHAAIALRKHTEGAEQGDPQPRQPSSADLENNCGTWLPKAIQTILRREGYPKPYEALKALTRTNSTVSRQESIAEFIDTLEREPTSRESRIETNHATHLHRILIKTSRLKNIKDCCDNNKNRGSLFTF
jgi:adenylosuccinate lyase